MNVALIGKFYTEGTGQHLTEAIESNGDKVIQIDPEINFYNGRLISKRMGCENDSRVPFFYFSVEISMLRFRVLTTTDSALLSNR